MISATACLVQVGMARAASLMISATACLVQVVRAGGKCIGMVFFNDSQLARKQRSVELVHFLARPGDGVLVHYLWCEKMKAAGAVEVSCCCNSV